MKGRAVSWVGLVALLAIAVAAVWLTSGAAPAPFDPESSTPDGYAALSILLRDSGSEVESISSSDLGTISGDLGDRSIVVPVASWMTRDQSARLEDLAEAGATVVLAAEDSFYSLDDRILTRTPAQPVRSGLCTMADLADLDAVDDISLEFMDVDPGGSPDTTYCFTDARATLGAAALVTRQAVGAGSIIRLSSPYLWANARLQPDKEHGGEPLDNASMGIALLGGSQVSFVAAAPPSGTDGKGTRSPLALMPFNVKLALVQLGFAFVVYLLWKGRRLGRPVTEQVPVEVAGSELVEAVGGLLRRYGSTHRAASELRERECRQFASRLGIPREGGPVALVTALSARSNRDPGEIHDLLFGAPPDGAEGLVALCAQLDELHMEVLDVEHAP